MAKVGVRIKLNVSQIDKARLFKGNKGVYLDATVFIDLDQKDQYDNNGMITQDITKEEKEQGVQGNILGNVQVFWSDAQQAAPQQQVQQPTQQLAQKRQQVQQQQQAPMNVDFDDSIPF